MNDYKVFMITGLPASGKTRVGKSLAKKLRFSFIDLDKYIEKENNSSITNIFKQKGESFFRLCEYEALIKILRYNTNNLILSLGGGTICYNKNLDICLSYGKLIWLKTDLNIIFTRLKKNIGKRPLFLNKNIYDVLSYLNNLRKQYYEKSNITININNEIHSSKLVEQIITKIL